MKLWLRAILAVISAGITWALYVYLPPYLLQFISSDQINLGIAQISIGSFPTLAIYIVSIGYLMVGVVFSQALADKGSKSKPFWGLGKIFLKICFWGIFLFVEFDTITVSAVLPSGGDLAVAVNLTVFFWYMMGSTLLDIIVTVLDFLVAFVPQKEKEPKMKKQKETTTSEPPPPEVQGSEGGINHGVTN